MIKASDRLFQEAAMPNDKSSRTEMISAIKTPLSFLVLGVLVVDGTVVGMAAAFAEFRTPLIWTVIVSIPLLMATVVVLAIWRPEALRGVRPLQAIYARQFASDLFLALDGSLSNLEPAERSEAWVTVADVITTEDEGDVVYSDFCAAVALHIKRLANLGSDKTILSGPISSNVAN